MALTPGTKLRQYEVIESIGAGGMGEVYRARDTKLGRDVAVKVLPDEFAQDQERLDRFEREARLLAQLNHANVATLHGLEEFDGQRFLVMELVEGETFAERIASGAMSLEDAVPLFVGIAEGLEAAHDKGIIHRDLKPANVKIGIDGKPKILDFGLAKAFAGDGETSPDSSKSPTLTKGTALGAIMGTASYMSPEQARGKLVDKRTDIWAFGCCLYEALSGRKAFDGDTVTDILSAVISREPDLKGLPAGGRRLLERCMDKDARRRLRDIGEARVALLSMDDSEPNVAESHPRSAPLAWLAVALALGALGLFLVRANLAPPMESSPLRRASIQLPLGQKLLFGGGARPSMALSPDGSKLVFAALPASGRARQLRPTGDDPDARLYLRPLDEARAVAIEDTEGGAAPFFSPDGRWVGFFADGVMKKVPVSGGASIGICPVTNPWGAEWQEDGSIIFSDVSGSADTLFRVSSAGGEPAAIPVADADETVFEYDFPQSLPAEESLLVSNWLGGSFADARIESVSLETGKRQTVIDGGGVARYVPTGHLVYSRGSRLLAAPFDVGAMSTTGTPVPVIDDVLAERTFGTPQFAVSPSGVLVYAAGSFNNDESYELVWLDAAGSELIFEDQPVDEPRLSRDGERIAFATGGGTDMDIWLHELRGRQFAPLTASPLEEFAPAWTADSERVLFHSFNRGQSGVFLKTSPQSEAEALFMSEDQVESMSMSFDGGWLAYSRLTPGTTDIMLVELGGSAPLEFSPLLESRFILKRPRFSPVEPLLAYESNETGRLEVWLRQLPGDATLRISREGGERPFWSRDGRTLYFHSDASLMASPVTMSPELRAGESRPVLELDNTLVFDVGNDGRFLAVRQPQEPSITHLEVVFNWFQELERLVPTEK